MTTIGPFRTVGMNMTTDRQVVEGALALIESDAVLTLKRAAAHLEAQERP